MRGVFEPGRHRLAFRLTMRDRVDASGREILSIILWNLIDHKIKNKPQL